MRQGPARIPRAALHVPRRYRWLSALLHAKRRLGAVLLATARWDGRL